MILKSIFSLALIVGCLAVPKIILNEVNIETKQVEYLIVDDSYANVRLSIVDKTLATKGLTSIPSGIPTGSLQTISINVPLNKPMLIVLYEDSALNKFTLFNSFDKKRIYDSLVISSNVFDTNPFTSQLPQWDNQVIQYSLGSSLSRCFQRQGNAPENWFSSSPTIGFPNDCPGDVFNAGGDPHFSQIVVDKKSKELVDICYDITGQSGQLISILYDNSTNTKVKGVLKDDYYMHEIRIQSKAGLIVVGQSSILVNDEKLPWVDSSEYKFNFVTIRMAKGTVFIESFYQNSKLTTVVKKGFRKYSGSYLNVYFKNIDLFYKGYGGLLGDIGKKSYAISDGIQLNYKTVQVDDVFLSGSVAKRFSHKCILLPVKRLLSPKKIDDYVY